MMSDTSKPQPDKYTVLLYSDDLAVRDRIRMAIGVRPAADLAVEFADASHLGGVPHPARRRTRST